MSHLRNVALSLLALSCLASASYAGNVGSKFTATYLGPTNKAANGVALVCSATTNCSMIRDGVVTPGQSRIAVIVVSQVDMLSLHVELGAWVSSGCGPDPTTPDLLTGSGDLVLPTAGRWIVSFNTADTVPAGTTYSQKWAVSTSDATVDCGVSYCVNSLAGNPGTAPADCDQP